MSDLLACNACGTEFEDFHSDEQCFAAKFEAMAKPMRVQIDELKRRVQQLESRGDDGK